MPGGVAFRVCRVFSDELFHRLVAVDEVVGASLEVLDRGGGRVDAHVVVERRDDLTEMYRAVLWSFAETVG